MTPLKVTAILASPIANKPPMLDGIIAREAYFRNQMHDLIITQRWQDIPPWTGEGIPILCRTCGGIVVPCASSPIYCDSFAYMERMAKRYPTESADLLCPKEQTKLETTAGPFKSSWRPVKSIPANEVVWFVVGNRRGLLKLLKRVDAIGPNRKCGYGRVKEWRIDRISDDWSWVCDGVLMRPLPRTDETMRLKGARPGYGAVQPPYWHPARVMEIVEPCF